MPAQPIASADADAAARGYQLLRSKPYLPAEFPASAFENIWRAWPSALQSRAKKATPEERRKMALSRYGLIEAPEDQDGIPMAYIQRRPWRLVVDLPVVSRWQGRGQSMPGLGNSHFAFTTLTHEVMRSWMLAGQASAVAVEPIDRLLGRKQRHHQRPSVQHSTHGPARRRHERPFRLRKCHLTRTMISMRRRCGT